MQHYVYILASRPKGVLYTGMTNDISKRLEHHRNENVDGFTKKYHVHKLVYCEAYDNPEDAIRREKNIKAWKRDWKVELVERDNAERKDLARELLD